MARGYLNEMKYRETDISNYIRNRMRLTHTTQATLAKKLGKTQARFSQELSECSFGAKDLLIIFKALDADKADVGKLFTFKEDK